MPRRSHSLTSSFDGGKMFKMVILGIGNLSLSLLISRKRCYHPHQVFLFLFHSQDEKSYKTNKVAVYENIIETAGIFYEC
jgi:hypothetical protein